MALYTLHQGRVKALQQGRLLPDFTQQSFFDLFTAVPVIVVAFTFHYNSKFSLLPVMPSPSLVSVHPINCLLFHAHGSHPTWNIRLLHSWIILSNFDRQSSASKYGSLLNDIVRLSYALHLVLVFPLLNFSLRLNVDEALFPKNKLIVLNVDQAYSTSMPMPLTIILLYFFFQANYSG